MPIINKAVWVKKASCPTCKAHRSVACPACKGKGRQVETLPSGLKEVVPCPSCNRGRLECIRCKGEGLIWKAVPTFTKGARRARVPVRV